MQTKSFVRPYQARPGPIQNFPVESQDFIVDRPSSGAYQPIQGTTVRQVKVRRNRVLATNVSQEWRTAPLWGLRDSAPYMHDGRAATVDEAIQMHDGESNWSRSRYQLLKKRDQAAVLAFLATFAAPVNAPQPGELSLTQTQ
jgi:cytochrome c peroxidase